MELWFWGGGGGFKAGKGELEVIPPLCCSLKSFLAASRFLFVFGTPELGASSFGEKIPAAVS